MLPLFHVWRLVTDWLNERDLMHLQQGQLVIA